jgi:hypothetical protein
MRGSYMIIRAIESCNKYTFYPKFKTDFKDRFYNFVLYYKSSQRWIVIKNPLAHLPPHLHLPLRLYLHSQFSINILFVTKLHTKKLKQVLFLYYLLLFYFIYIYLFLQKEVFI